MKLYLTIILLVVSAFSEAKKDEVIDFKVNKGLKDDEGLAILVLDINFRIAKVSLAKEGKLFPVYSLKKPKQGKSIRIIKLKAGKYYWKEGVGYSDKYIYNFEMKKEDTIFEVKAGKMNYPGSLEFRGWREKGEIVFQYNLVNNSTQILDELTTQFESLVAKYPLIYSGSNPDPFLEYQENLKNENNQ